MNNNKPVYRTREQALSSYPTTKILYVFEKYSDMFSCWVIMYASTMIADVRHYIKDNNISEYEKG